MLIVFSNEYTFAFGSFVVLFMYCTWTVASDKLASWEKSIFNIVIVYFSDNLGLIMRAPKKECHGSVFSLFFHSTDMMC